MMLGSRTARPTRKIRKSSAGTSMATGHLRSDDLPPNNIIATNMKTTAEISKPINEKAIKKPNTIRKNAPI